MKKNLLVMVFTILLCITVTYTEVLAASGGWVFPKYTADFKVHDKTYSIDASSDCTSANFSCKNRKGTVSLIRKISGKEFGFDSQSISGARFCCSYAGYLYLDCRAEMEECGLFSLSVKDGKLKKIQDDMQIYGLYQNRYIVLRSTEAGDYFPYQLMLYDIKTGKKKWINKQPTGHSYVEGKYVYYSKVPSTYYGSEFTCYATICRYNVVTGRNTTLVKNLMLSDIEEINKDYVAYTIEPNTFKIVEFGKGKKVAPKDGELYVNVNRGYRVKKPDCYALHIKGNTLTLYGSYKTKGKNDAKKAGMYKFTLSPTYKIGLYEDGDIEYTNASRFNRFFDDKNFENGGILTVKNGKVTEILMYP